MIIGGIIGAIFVVAVMILFFWYKKTNCNTPQRPNAETDMAEIQKVAQPPPAIPTQKPYTNQTSFQNNSKQNSARGSVAILIF